MKQMKEVSKAQKLTISGILLALYIVIMMTTQGFAFGQYQVRVATALYGLAALFPFSVVVLGLANLLSNLIMGGLGLVDVIGGCVVGLLTAGSIAWAKKKGMGNWVVIPLVTFIPGLLVPIWLSWILNIPYVVLAGSLLIGQAISGVISFVMVNGLERFQSVIPGIEVTPKVEDEYGNR